MRDTAALANHEIVYQPAIGFHGLGTNAAHGRGHLTSDKAGT